MALASAQKRTMPITRAARLAEMDADRTRWLSALAALQRLGQPQMLSCYQSDTLE
jgi:hypothetical protein